MELSEHNRFILDDIWLKVLPHMNIMDVVSFSATSHHHASLAKMMKRTIFNVRLVLEGDDGPNEIIVEPQFHRGQSKFPIEIFFQQCSAIEEPIGCSELREARPHEERSLIEKGVTALMHLVTVFHVNVVDIRVCGDVGVLPEFWIDVLRNKGNPHKEMLLRGATAQVAETASKIFKSAVYTFLRCDGEITPNDNIMLASRVYFPISIFSPKFFSDRHGHQFMWACNSVTFIDDEVIAEKLMAWLCGERMGFFQILSSCVDNTVLKQCCEDMQGESVDLKSPGSFQYNVVNVNGEKAKVVIRPQDTAWLEVPDKARPPVSEKKPCTLQVAFEKQDVSSWRDGPDGTRIAPAVINGA